MRQHQIQKRKSDEAEKLTSKTFVRVNIKNVCDKNLKSK